MNIHFNGTLYYKAPASMSSLKGSAFSALHLSNVSGVGNNLDRDGMVVDFRPTEAGRFQQSLAEAFFKSAGVPFVSVPEGNQDFEPGGKWEGQFLVPFWEGLQRQYEEKTKTQP